MSTNGNIFHVTGPNSLFNGEFLSPRPVRQNFNASLIAAWTNGWTNHRDAGDVRCHRAHYDVTVMLGFGFSKVNEINSGDQWIPLAKAQ